MPTTPSSTAQESGQTRHPHLPEMYYEYLSDRYWILSSGITMCLTKADALQMIHNYTGYSNDPEPRVRYTEAECLLHAIRLRNPCAGIPTIAEDTNFSDWNSAEWDADGTTLL